MKILPFSLAAIITVALIMVLDMPLPVKDSHTPRLGYFLSPQKGFWQNADPVDQELNETHAIKGLQGNANVYFDDRMVPHVYAENEHDAIFLQGYLHAKFRLWQMDFQSYAAGGRLSEIMGDSSNGTNFLKIDRFFRRLGMVSGAENSLASLESNPETKAYADAYTEGVNYYISNLKDKDIPFEYKLLNYKPEKWTNLKSVLFMKYMAFDLAGFEQDFEMTNAKSVFSKTEMAALYPYGQDSLDPIIPKGTKFAPAAFSMKPPAGADSVYFNYHSNLPQTDSLIKPDKSNGSNNWAVSGNKTKSGKPILCNDPHLGLNLPSLWFEMQISTPQMNAYGASFPGAPSIVIGFNDSCAWGFTNAMRDVRDYFEIKFKDSSKQEYWYDSAWQKTTFRNEVIHIKGKPDHIEKIPETIWGPVMYDQDYPDMLHTGKAYACHWQAQDGSNEIKTFRALDFSKNYDDYIEAMKGYECPGQNMIFACKRGDIALKQNGKFPAKWRGQGDFLMPGENDTYAWRGFIPDSANIVDHNPSRGFVSSANQLPYDTSYPYYLGGVYPVYRGYLINRYLGRMQQITVQDMEKLQTNNYNIFQEMARPILLKYIDQSALSEKEMKYLDIYIQWNLQNDAIEKGPTIEKLWWDSLMTTVYSDEFSRSSLPLPWPEKSTLLDGLLKDSTHYLFLDNTLTSSQETLQNDITSAFKKMIPVLEKADSENNLVWGKFKKSGIRHLLRIPVLSRLDLFSSGGETEINALKEFHGPSWRMIVELTDSTQAYGIYPGGQSGNPGSPYYDNFVNNWVQGKYYPLLFMKETAMKNRPGLKGTMIFKKA
ncbi:MAG: penicillin acylase family protein [Bacteroidetes bacterium]|nr:penicillin acylase family protein [Bacteroidota bacterium]